MFLIARDGDFRDALLGSADVGGELLGAGHYDRPSRQPRALR